MTPEAMRARFDDLGREKDGILSQSAPLRAQMDALTAVIEQKKGEVRPIFKQIQQIEARLFDLDMERAALARALGGKTMSQSTAGPAPVSDGSNVILMDRLKALEADNARLNKFLSEFKTNVEQG